MIVVDLNVLIYAVNSASPNHVAVSRWWNDAVNGDEAIGLPWTVLGGFVRLTTRNGIMPRPLGVEAALRVVDEWLGLEQVVVPHESEGHWAIMRRLLANAGTGGNLVSDAHLAALAIGHGARLATCDGDFARFDGLKVISPLAG